MNMSSQWSSIDNTLILEVIFETLTEKSFVITNESPKDFKNIHTTGNGWRDTLMWATATINLSYYQITISWYYYMIYTGCLYTVVVGDL